MPTQEQIDAVAGRMRLDGWSWTKENRNSTEAYVQAVLGPVWWRRARQSTRQATLVKVWAAFGNH